MPNNHEIQGESAVAADVPAQQIEIHPLQGSGGVEKTHAPAPTVTTAAGNIVAAPIATEEDERHSAGQRAVNLIWETTQAKIAVAVVYVGLVVAAALSLAGLVPWATEKQIALAITAFMLLSSLCTLVIGFYYGRTNHSKNGGVQWSSRDGQ